MKRQEKRELFELGFTTAQIKNICENGRERELLDILSDRKEYLVCRENGNFVGASFHCERLLETKAGLI